MIASWQLHTLSLSLSFFKSSPFVACEHTYIRTYMGRPRNTNNVSMLNYRMAQKESLSLSVSLFLSLPPSLPPSLPLAPSLSLPLSPSLSLSLPPSLPPSLPLALSLSLLLSPSLSLSVEGVMFQVRWEKEKLAIYTTSGTYHMGLYQVGCHRVDVHVHCTELVCSVTTCTL